MCPMMIWKHSPLLFPKGVRRKRTVLRGCHRKSEGRRRLIRKKKKEFLKKLLTKTVKMMQYKLTVGEWENDEQFGFAAQSWDQVLEMTDDKKGSHIASEMKAILHCFEEQFKLTNFPNLDVSVNALLKGISPDPSERVNVSVYKRTRRTEKFLGSNGRQREKVVVMPWKGIETLLPISQLDILRGGNQDIMKDLYSQSVSSAQLILRQSVVLMDTPVKEEEE